MYICIYSMYTFMLNIKVWDKKKLKNTLKTLRVTDYTFLIFYFLISELNV